MVSHAAEYIELAPGVELLTENKPADSVYFLKSGAVKILVNGEMVAQIDKPQCFGEMSCLTPDTTASASVITASPCQMFRISKNDFLISVDQIPKLWKVLFLQMSERVRSVNGRLSEILNHLPQSLVKVSPDGIISNDYTIHCTKLFQRENLAGLSFAKIAFPNEEEKQKTWNENLKLLFSDSNMSFEAIAKILVSEFSIKGETETREYAMTYSPCKNTFGKIVAVDIGIEDITQQKELERKHDEMQSRQAILGKVTQNPDSFVNFLSSAEEVFIESTDFIAKLKKEGLESVVSRIDDMMRRLHNIKGSSGVFSLLGLKKSVHETETMVGKVKTKALDREQIVSSLEQCLSYFKAEKDKASGVLDGMASELRRRLLGVVFSQQEFETLKRLLAEKKYHDIDSLLSSIEKVDSKKLVDQWPQEVQKISAELGKVAHFNVTGEGGRISKDLFLNLDKVLIHLLRNGLDHGLEIPDERIKKGKIAQGKIVVTLEVLDTEFFMCVEDDGNGIDKNALVARSRQNQSIDQNLIDKHISNNEEWKILLMPGFSTAKVVTDISGRGVGLDSVANAVESLGGALTIESEFGKGTRFNILIPI